MHKKFQGSVFQYLIKAAMEQTREELRFELPAHVLQGFFDTNILHFFWTF